MKDENGDGVLPAGWFEIPLLELLVSLESGKRPRGGVRGISEGVPSLGGEHLTASGGFDFTNTKYVPQGFALSMRRGHIQKGDVLIVKDGATTGKTALVGEGFPFEEAVANEHLFVCRPAESTLPMFLASFLRSPDGQRRILKHFQGSAQGGINKSFATGTIVLVPPLAEQRRIAERLDDIHGRRGSIGDHLRTARTDLDRLRGAVLAAACSGRLTEAWRDDHPNVSADERIPSDNQAPSLFEVPDGWGWSTLESIAEIRGGVQVGAKSKSTESVRKVPYLRVANVQRGWLDLSEIKMLSVSEKKIAALKLQPGDILFNEGGDRDKLGRGWIWEGQLDECIHQNHVFRARLYNGEFEPRFYSWFGNSVGMRYFLKEGRQTVNLASLSKKRLGHLPVPIPPPAEQAEIVRRVDVILTIADRLSDRLEQTARMLDRLTGSALTWAVRGELVPTEAALAAEEGRDYETAEELLTRIKAKTRE